MKKYLGMLACDLRKKLKRFRKSNLKNYFFSYIFNFITEFDDTHGKPTTIQRTSITQHSSGHITPVVFNLNEINGDLIHENKGGEIITEVITKC